MRLKELEEQLVNSLNINELKVEVSERLRLSINDPNSEMFSSVIEDLTSEIDISSIRIEYDSSALHFDHVAGCGPFIRLKYLLYVEDVIIPLFSYDVDLGQNGEVLDDYLIEF